MAIQELLEFCEGGHRPKKFTWNFPSYSWAKFLCEATPGKTGKVPSERKVWRCSPCPVSRASIPDALLHSNPSGLTADREVRKPSSALRLQSTVPHWQKEEI